MKNLIWGYFIILGTSLILDWVWLSLVAKNFYKKHIGFLMADTPNLKVALLFYLIFAVAMIVFVIHPALTQNYSILKVILYGALLGLVIYGAYDFTNQALFKNWPVVVTITDIIWGVAMSTITAVVSFVLIRLI